MRYRPGGRPSSENVPSAAGVANGIGVGSPQPEESVRATEMRIFVKSGDGCVPRSVARPDTVIPGANCSTRPDTSAPAMEKSTSAHSGIGAGPPEGVDVPGAPRAINEYWPDATPGRPNRPAASGRTSPGLAQHSRSL